MIPLDILTNEYPQLALLIKKQLKYYVRRAEERYGADRGSYWFRPLRPDDPEVGGTARQMYATFTNGTEEQILAQDSLTVPNANMYVMFGWYGDFDAGAGGYIKTKKNNVVKQEIPARFIYEEEHPRYLYLDFDHVIFGYENDKLEPITYNNFGADQVGTFVPYMFRIATKSALNLQEGEAEGII